MAELSKIISDKFLEKGFTQVEIPGLLRDLIYLIKQIKNCTTNYINQELKNLGWGIQLLDESLFKEIASYLIRVGDIPKQN